MVKRGNHNTLYPTGETDYQTVKDSLSGFLIDEDAFNWVVEKKIYAEEPVDTGANMT